MNPNTKIMVVFFLTTLASCNLFEKKPFIADKNDPIIKIKENNEDIKEKIKIFPYEGKYSLEKKFLSLTRITEIYEKLSILLAEKIGLEKNPIEIEIKYVDWIPKYGEDKYFIFPKIESSKNTWKIRYVSEYLQNGNISSAIIYKTSLAEILIRNFSENGYGILPTAIWQSIIYYVCDLGEYLQKTAILSILKKPNSSLDTTIVGLDSSIFSTLEAYLSLLYVKNKYNQDGKEVVKKFINAILFKNVEWQKQLDITTGEVFGIFVENCKIFSKNLLHNNYQVVFSKYNSILKSYLNNEYGTTIAKGQTFLLNYHDSFLSRDTYFWMALSYYNLKNYDFCIAQLEAMFAENNKFSNYFALAKYRYAMALYRQEKLSYAIEIFSNFQRDFPW